MLVNRERALEVRAYRMTPLTGRSRRCTVPMNASPGLLYFRLTYSPTTRQRVVSPLESLWTMSDERLLTAMIWLSS